MIALALLLTAVPDIKINDTSIEVAGRRIELGAHVTLVSAHPSRPFAAVFVAKEVLDAEADVPLLMSSDALWLVDLETGRKRRFPTGVMGPSSWNGAPWSPDGRWFVHGFSHFGPFEVIDVDALPKWIRRGGRMKKMTAKMPGPGKVYSFIRWMGAEAEVALACCGTETRFVLDPTKDELRLLHPEPPLPRDNQELLRLMIEKAKRDREAAQQDQSPR